MPRRNNRNFRVLSDLARRQEGKLVEMSLGAQARQSALIRISVDSAIRIIVEEMIKSGAGFEELKEKGFIKQDFSSEIVLPKSDESGSSLSKKVKNLQDNGVIVSSQDIVTPEEIDAHDQRAKTFRSVMDNYDREVFDYLKELELYEVALITAHTNPTKLDDYMTSITSHLDALWDFRDDAIGNFPEQLVLPNNLYTPEPPKIPKIVDSPIKLPQDPRVVALNKLGEGIIRIREAGVKGVIRTEEKAEELGYHMITDITRLTVIPINPDIAKRIAAMVSEDRDNYDKGDVISIGGFMRRKIALDIGGFLSEVQVVDEGQDSAYAISHNIYKTTRRMEDRKTGTFNDSLLDERRRRTICKEYNALMDEFKENHPIAMRIFKEGKYVDFSFSRRDIEDFRGENLTERYDELIRLHQAIHISEVIYGVDHGRKEWSERYMQKAYKLNAERAELGHSVIPEDMLAKVPLEKPDISSKRGVRGK